VETPTADEAAAHTSTVSTVLSLSGVTAEAFGSVPAQAVLEATASEFGVHTSQVSVDVLTAEATEAVNSLRANLRIRCGQAKALQVQAKMALLAASSPLQALFASLANKFLAQHGTGLAISVAGIAAPVLTTGAPTAYPTLYPTTSAPTKAPTFLVQYDIDFSAIWETPTHLCAGGVCAWSTCADWKSSSCPLPCADVTIRTEVMVQAKKTSSMITVGKHGNLKVGSKAEVVVKRSTAGCCAHLGTNYVQDDAKGKCVVSDS